MPAPSSKSDRTWWIVGLGLVLLWVLYLRFFGPKAPTGAPPLEPLAREVYADYGWKVVDLDDKPVDLSRYKGRTVVLNVWATWCAPCVSEMPSIAKLAEEPRLKDVVFLCVSVDETTEAVRHFLQGKNWKMTILRAQEPPPSVLQSPALPVTFLIGPDGKIATAVEGGAEWDDPAVVAFLEKLKASPSAANPSTAPSKSGAP